MLIVAVAAGLSYAWLAPTRYAYRSGIEIGTVYYAGDQQVAGERYRSIASAELVQAQLNDQIIPMVRRTLAAQGKSVPEVSVLVRSPTSVTLRTEAVEGAQERVEDVHTAIASKLAEYHQSAFQQERSLSIRHWKVLIDTLETELVALREQSELLQGRRPRAGTDAGIVALIDAQQLAELNREMATLRGNLARARAALESVEQASRSTRLTFVASQSEDPLGVGTAVILVLAVVLGALGGAFIALVWEFISNARRLREQSAGAA